MIDDILCTVDLSQLYTTYAIFTYTFQYDTVSPSQDVSMRSRSRSRTVAGRQGLKSEIEYLCSTQNDAIPMLSLSFCDSNTCFKLREVDVAVLSSITPCWMEMEIV